MKEESQQDRSTVIDDPVIYGAFALEPLGSRSAALGTQSRFFDAALSVSPDCICAYDRERKLVYSNGAMQKLLRLSGAELQGKKFAELRYSSAMADRFDGHIDHVFAHGLSIDDELFCDSPEGVNGIYRFSWGPVLLQDGSVELAVSVSREMTEWRRMEKLLREDEDRYRHLSETAQLQAAELHAVIENMSDAIYIGSADGISIANQSALDQLGYSTPEQLNRHVATLAEEVETRDLSTGLPIAFEAQPFIRALRGERVVENVRIRHRVTGEERTVRSAASPVVVDGRIIAAVAVNTDITDRVRVDASLRESEAHQRTLLSELQHRVRNTLSVVRSIVRRTAESSDDIEDFANHLDGRLGAFARVQVAMTRDPLGGFDLAELVAEELRSAAAREGEHFTLRGGPLRLNSKSAQSLGLAIHELATNAVKFGALSAPRGHVTVDWRREERRDAPWILLRWKESGLKLAPSLQVEKDGFGSTLLTKALQYELDAEVLRRFEPNGLLYEIAFPAAGHV